MELGPLKAGFVGFGEVNTPRELIERKCAAARDALTQRGVELTATDPVADDPQGEQEARARRELARGDWDVLIVCVAGWIPSHTVMDVIAPFRDRPMVLWALAGSIESGRLVTTADQAGATALRAPMEAMGFRFDFVYDTHEEPYAAADQVVRSCEVARAARLLRGARVGMVGYRDMKLHSTLVDGVSLRRVVGPEVEVVDTLEIAQLMERVPDVEIDSVIDDMRKTWRFDREADRATLERPVRLYLAIMEKVHERGYAGISVIDVDGIKKLMGFTPAAAMMLLADRGGVTTIPENDGMGAVTQLMVHALTGQASPYFEFYEFMRDRVLMGVPDYVPAAVVDGEVQVRLAKFGDLSEGVLNVSRVRPGRVTICRLGKVGEAYRLHVATGEAVQARPWEEAGWDQPAPQLPGLEIVLDGSVSDFASRVFGQHYVIAYGDERVRLTALCRLLGVEVVGGS